MVEMKMVRPSTLCIVLWCANAVYAMEKMPENVLAVYSEKAAESERVVKDILYIHNKICEKKAEHPNSDFWEKKDEKTGRTLISLYQQWGCSQARLGVEPLPVETYQEAAKSFLQEVQDAGSMDAFVTFLNTRIIRAQSGDFDVRKKEHQTALNCLWLRFACEKSLQTRSEARVLVNYSETVFGLAQIVLAKHVRCCPQRLFFEQNDALKKSAGVCDLARVPEAEFDKIALQANYFRWDEHSLGLRESRLFAQAVLNELKKKSAQ